MIDHEYEFSTDNSRLDIATIHGYLTQSYWSPGVPRAIVERGKWLSKRLMELIMAHPDLGGLRQFGFTALAEPSRVMEVLRPDVYQSR